MRGGVFSKNIWEGASERRNENIKVSGTLKILSKSVISLLIDRINNNKRHLYQINLEKNNKLHTDEYFESSLVISLNSTFKDILYYLSF